MSPWACRQTGCSCAGTHDGDLVVRAGVACVAALTEDYLLEDLGHVFLQASCQEGASTLDPRDVRKGEGVVTCLACLARPRGGLG